MRNDIHHVAEDFSQAGKYIEQFGQAVVVLGKKAIDGIISIAKKAWKWILAHKAEIAGIVVGFIVSTVIMAGLTLTTMNPVLAGVIAGAAGAFVGNEVKQIVYAAEQGRLRAPRSAADFFHLAGEHLKDDIIPVATGGLAGGLASVAGIAAGEAVSASAGETVGTITGKVASGATSVTTNQGSNAILQAAT